MKKQNSIKLDHVTPRQSLSYFAALALLAASGGSVLAAETTTVKPEEALKRLQVGNERFVAGTPTQTTKDAKRRAEVAQGQKPFAIVVSCSDSRVGPEVVFDQGLGDIFVVRTAGMWWTMWVWAASNTQSSILAQRSSSCSATSGVVRLPPPSRAARRMDTFPQSSRR